MTQEENEMSAPMLGSAAKCRPIGAYVHTPTHDDLVAEIARLRLTDAEREADVARLRVAATALYRHRWACDDLQPDEQAVLWESMRDAIGLPVGTATSMGVHGRVEQ